MENARATLLLTRPEPQSKSFLVECEALLGRRVPVVVSPLLEIVPRGNLADLSRFATIAVTSGNAVRCLADSLAGRRVVTVGIKTCELARSFGAMATCLGDSVAAFLDEASEIVGPVVYGRGVHTRGDLAAGLRSLGIEVEEAVLYDQVARALSPAARALIVGDEPVVLPLFSPRTADLMSQYEVTAPLKVVAMSDAVREAWGRDGDVEVADEPTARAMSRAVAEAL